MKKFEHNMNEPIVESKYFKEAKEMSDEKKRKYYDAHHPINFKRLLLAQDGCMIEPQKNLSYASPCLEQDGDYLHPVEVRCEKDPENGIEIDFWNELTDEDSLITLRIQFRKGHTCMGWICNWDGSLRLKPKKS